MEEIEAITTPKLLLVEGKDEKNIFTALLSHLSLEDIQVLDIAGKTKIHKKLKALTTLAPNFSNVTSIGIVRDADDKPKGAFQSICSALKKAGLSVPRKQLSFTAERPKIGILILPKPGSKGMLEDICLESIKDTPEVKCIKIYFDCIKKNTKTLPNNLSKAKIHAFLAAKEPGLRLGEAAQKGRWQWDHEAFNGIKNFLRML